ncbi:MULTISPECIES: LacI family DNA-binding transcriptional regulator [Streptomyces]|uniref:HTH-type transcriptional regulator GalR n=2 Tax=Streptomyces TaxID=1883 RepID=A0A1D8G0H9_9ACTN|nr:MULTISPECIES: LacI family DNA-binding transcriptional regulator [Streptomyces]AOT58967.1 HTH-type transcriptional regulator GalR [Streptomyces rubrolavendulae]KAF0650243.1 LacI family transcriptional regulator [Streptomyces fradiae ATCC 10745 = DSM 40063]OSY49354.1 HTH-type transcriptional regulator GalR [Streptomyces fradiae ATCC 10745 = DSM 40063]QEV12309.1 LacI family transcriptional regulator [Streptomyces fradiae ATCC 10745 = DSM 40063]UQS28140.1 LacI family DNA-binding transcriptional
MTVTLADVAARARVSPATVSRVLNGNYPVAESTRERVLRAVDELDYVLNGPASALAAATSDLVGILVNDIADPFFGIIAGAAQSAIGDTGSGRAGGEKLAVVCNTGGSPEKELTYLTLLQRQRATAVVVTGGAPADPDHIAALTAKLTRLGDAGTRVVLCGRPPLPGDAATATLAFDNRGGARGLTGHLLALGHRRIGYVAGPADRTTTRDRLDGHRDAMAAAGLAGPELDRLTVYGQYTRASGYEATRELLAREPSLTAVVAANDTVALGACAALRGAGLRIPEDVSVAGFDDLPFSVDAVPSLTTVRLPLHEAGVRAGRLAMGVEAPPPGGTAVIPGELTLRASTAPPRA